MTTNDKQISKKISKRISKRTSKTSTSSKSEKLKLGATSNHFTNPKRNSSSAKKRELEAPIRTLFPAGIINQSDIVLEKKPYYQNTLFDTEEIHFKGKYKGVPILCACIPSSANHRQMLFHEFRMASRLSVCRNMGAYFSIFEASLSDMNVSLEKILPTQPIFFIIRQYYANHSLKRYIEKGRRNGLEVEPMYAIQMGINLFSMISDAHKLDTYLVDISKHSIFVDTDGSLHFCGFRSCLGPGTSFSQKPWIDLKHMNLPEKRDDKDYLYTKFSDVYLACSLLLGIILEKTKRPDRLLKIDHKTKSVTIIESSIGKQHKQLWEAIKRGLEYDPEERLTANEILESLENIRNQSTFARISNYSTSQHLSNIPQNQEKSEDSHFWEISEEETKTSKKSSSDARDFQDLLGSLFDDALNAREHFVPSRVEPPQKKNKSEESAIEKKLLELVKKRVYKSKSPLPKSISGSFHYNEEKEQLEKNEGSILDEVEPFDYNWYKEKVMNDERIRAKEKELQIKNAIIESKSVYELLDIINSEINQVSYPDYYSKIIKSAIEYTAKKDPYLTLSIFEQIKAKSIQSYISGCTTGTYNAILLLRWETWRDVHGMLDLLEEMALNGIRVNNETRNIVRMAVTAVEQEEGTESDNRQGLFWNADEKRVCNIMKEMANKWLIKK